MDPTLINFWGPQMRRALRHYFTLHGVPDPDPAVVECLAAIGIAQIDRDNLGFKAPTFFVVASFLVPAFLHLDHRLHAEITAAVQYCKDSLPVRAGGTAAVRKPRGSLANVVALTQGAKLPLLGKSAKMFAGAAAKAAPKRGKPTRRGTR